MSKHFKLSITNIETGELVEAHEALNAEAVLEILATYGYTQLEHVPYGYQEISMKYAFTIVHF